MPYPNEHACRIQSPARFDSKRGWSRVNGGSIYGGKIKIPKSVSVIRGKIKGKSLPDDPPIVQALRFPTRSWTVAKAKKFVKDNKIKCIKFEPARKNPASVVSAYIERRKGK